MKALVTGVAGFIGSHIAERLVRDGHHVIGIDDLSAGYRNNVPYGVTFVDRDICHIPHYAVVLEGVDVIFHNAASKKNICLRDPMRDMEVNGIGTLRLLTEAVNKGVKKFVHASTGSVYGEVTGTITEATARNPVSYYGISKTAGESYVNQFSDRINTTVLRYFHVYGDRQESNPVTGGVVSIFTQQIRQDQRIVIHGDGFQRRVFTSVRDIVEANIQSWLNPVSAGKTYNCASSFQLTIIDLALLLMRREKKQTSLVYADPLPGDIRRFDVSSEKILTDLGVIFKPITDIL